MRAPRPAFVYLVRLAVFGLGVVLSYGAHHILGTIISLVRCLRRVFRVWGMHPVGKS